MPDTENQEEMEEIRVGKVETKSQARTGILLNPRIWKQVKQDREVKYWKHNK